MIMTSIGHHEYYYDDDLLLQCQIDLHFKYVSEFTKYILTEVSFAPRRCLSMGRSVKSLLSQATVQNRIRPPTFVLSCSLYLSKNCRPTNAKYISLCCA